MDLAKHAVLAAHLMEHFDDEATGYRYTSGFLVALGSARINTGRNSDGNVVNELETGDWLGAVAWMALLDQIGTCFRPTPSAGTTPDAPSDRSLVNALHWWYPELPEPEVMAVYALRCAFLHDFSLWNVHKNPSLQHCFTVDRDPARFVQLPKERWSPGDAPTHDNQTYVSLRKLGDVVEEIVSRVRASAEQDTLDIVLEGGVNELRQRYGIRFFRER